MYIRGSGKGRETAFAFVAAGGAKLLVLIGRIGSMLAGRKDVLEAKSNSVVYLTFPADITRHFSILDFKDGDGEDVGVPRY